jgi:peptidyl-prolyl cis-trans isomerase D
MFAAFRGLFKSRIFTVLLFGLLVIAFAIVGAQTSAPGVGVSSWVIKAGSRTVSAIEFKRRFDDQKRQMEQQNGPISIEMAAINGLDQQMLRALAAQESLSALIAKAGIHTSDAQVAKELRKNPELFNSVTGQFDQDAYQQRLVQAGLTPAVFEGLMRDDMAAQAMVSGLAAGLRAPRIYTSWIGAFALESRDLSLFTLDPGMVPRPAPATDAELATFLKENAARFTKPEMRVLSVVDFNPAGLEAQAVVDPAEVQKRFDFRKETLSKPETRTLQQISAADAGQAALIAGRLQKGENPEVVAASLKRPITTLADRPRSALTDPKIAAAAFALAPGQSSNPIAAGLGQVVLKLISVTPGVTADLTAERPKIEAEIRSQFAQDKLDEQIQAYDTAHSGGMSLAAAAAKAGAKIVTIGPVTAQGVDAAGKPVPGATPAILKTAFALSGGSDSEVEDAGAGASFAVRVERIVPAVLPSVTEVKPLLLELFAARRTMDALNARAAALSERITKGEPLAAVAASAGAQVITLKDMNRLRASQDPAIAQAIPRDLLEKMFTVKPGEAFVADGGPPRVIVAKLEAVRPGDVNQVARIIEAQRPQLTAQVFRDMQGQAQSHAAKVMQAKTSLTRARKAIGIDEALAAKADGKPAPKA